MLKPSSASGLSHRFALVLQTLRDVIAARAGREQAVSPIVLLLWPYLHRLAARFASLAGRVQAGGAAVAPRKSGRAAASRPPAPHLPRGFGWLIRLAPEAAPLGGQLLTLLADPELAALLAKTPLAGRLLRPLCRMLGIAPGPDLPPALVPPPQSIGSQAAPPNPDASTAPPPTPKRPPQISAPRGLDRSPAMA